MKPRFRIFVSSPSDVKAAREIAALTIERLAQDYARFLIVEPYLWEFEAMLASGHFQDSVEPPSAFDVVILILWSRLGTHLPERTSVREYRGLDGRAPVTGSEWEFEEALRAAKDSGAPDLLVYRDLKPAPFDTHDPSRFEQQSQQLKALNGFWERHFANRGMFIGAYTSFDSDADFAKALENHLRKLIEKRIAARTAPRDAITKTWSQAPFRGLEAYEFEHAAIYFGQDEALAKAMLQLTSNAEAGAPFLLILGASGSGKSSLVQAGMIPKLFVPRRVAGSAFLRRVVFRPSDALEGDDLFDALARRLITPVSSQEGMPELLGFGQSVASLAEHLRQAAAAPAYPISTALGQLTVQAKQSGGMLEFEGAKLVLFIDQLEELFTNERIGDAERQRFIELLVGLVHSGFVWVIATMRNDFWYRAYETPSLVKLADGESRHDLLPPGSAQLSQMIRRPAEAAGITFEVHGTTGVALNEVIAEEVAREPGALPLLSYLLDQLYQKDVHEAGGSVITNASYKALGGLKGAIAMRADALVAAQPPEVRLALRQVLFALVQMSSTDGSVERAVARRAPLSDFPQGTPKRRLIQALLDPGARLLVADAVDGEIATVRLAHEALISEWQTARDFVSDYAEALKTRHMLEERYRRWSGLSSAGPSTARVPASKLSFFLTSVRRPFLSEHGLLTDVDLSDARRLLQHYREELAPDLVAYIERSIVRNRRRRQRTVRAVAAVAAVMTVLAIGAGYEAKVASAQRDTALQAQLRSLTQTAAARLHENDVAGSLNIIFEVLEPGGTRRPYTSDALSVFQEARAADTASFAITEPAVRVRSAMFSPDGKQFVTALADNTARIWDSSTGQQVALLRGHTDGLTFARYSPDGKQIVTASQDKTARVWDTATGRQLALLSGHTDWLFCAAFSPDGKHIVTASGDNTARIWDSSTGQQVALLSGHTQRVYSAEYSPDGKHIVTASGDKTARIWDIAGRQLSLLSGHDNQLYYAMFSPDGKQILTASADGTAVIWDAAGRQVSLLLGHTNGVYSAAFSADGKRIVTASEDKTARVWDTAGRQELLLSGHTDGVVSAAFSPDGRHIVTASADATARIWDTAGRQVSILGGRSEGGYGAVFSADGKFVVTASADATARIWDAAGQQLSLMRGHTDIAYSAAFSPDGRQIVTASQDKTARIWDTAGRQLALLSGHTDAVYSAAFSPDGKHIVTASADKTARIWDTAGRQLALLSGHTDAIMFAAFSPDGTQIVTASADKTARIWDTAGRQLSLLSGHTDGLLSAMFSPDGSQIVTASSDKTARVWDTAGRQLLLLSGHSDGLTSAAFSPDGKQIVTASGDNTARIWDTAGRQLLVLSGRTDQVVSAMFSPDGARILTAINDESGDTAQIWDARVVGLKTQIDWARAAQFDPLSAAERFRLGLPPLLGVRAWPPDASSCDLAAAAPYDPDRRASGVMLAQLIPDIGLAACTQGGGNREKETRLVYQHGRASMAHGDFADARRDFDMAIAGGYRVAQVDLAMLLSTTEEVADPQKAVLLYEQAWKDGVRIAAFQLGGLYEHGVSATGKDTRSALPPDAARAWLWYKQAAEAGEPNALARFAERQDAAAFVADTSRTRDELLLDSFKYYAAAAERARTEDWPDEAWRNWRYRRASLARILARDGMTQEVADSYAEVLKKWASRPAS